MPKKIVSVFFAISLTACAASPKKAETQMLQCPSERPQICTREYMPVCATRDTGIRCVTTPCPSSEEKTYGNACTACADEKVSAYSLGACKTETQQK